MSRSLPPYTNRATNISNKANGDAPPAYAFPETFAIGTKRTSAALVDSAQLKGHLALLHAFAELRKQVDGLDKHAQTEHQVLIPDDKERRWAWFVGLAVERLVALQRLESDCDVNNGVGGLQIFNLVLNYGIQRYRRQINRRCSSAN
jgi:hypothetical protein